MEQILSDYQKATSNEIAILIVPGLQGAPIDEAAFDVGDAWGIGTEENDNGILILVSYEDRSVFIATGYGLEGAVPDLVAHGIIEQDITPAFREGKYYEGLLAAVDSLKKHIAGEYTQDRYAASASIPGIGWIIFFLFIVFDGLGSYLARSKSWWLGGILGGVFGIVLTVLFTWWLSIPVLVILGLFLDYFLSKRGPRRGRRLFRGGGFGGWGGGSSGGGFGGFSGGSFGGGGAGGRW